MKKEKEQATAGKQTAGDSMQTTFTLFQQGLKMEQIAAQRNLSPSTIATHLADLISMGQVTIDSLVNEENVALIAKVFKASPDKTLTEIKGILGDTFTYNELKFVKHHLLVNGELVVWKKC